MPVWVSVKEVALDVDAVVVKTTADIKTVVVVVVVGREGEGWVRRLLDRLGSDAVNVVLCFKN